MAFLVRGIDRITECNCQNIEAPPQHLGSSIFVTGVMRKDNKLIQLLDVELLLSKIFPDDPSTLLPSLTDVERETLRPLKILLVDDSAVGKTVNSSIRKYQRPLFCGNKRTRCF